MRELEEKEREIEETLTQNNQLMKLLLQGTRESKSKMSTMRTDNVELKKKVSSLKTELDQKTNEMRAISSGDKVFLRTKILFYRFFLNP